MFSRSMDLASGSAIFRWMCLGEKIAWSRHTSFACFERHEAMSTAMKGSYRYPSDIGQSSRMQHHQDDMQHQSQRGGCNAIQQTMLVHLQDIMFENSVPDNAIEPTCCVRISSGILCHANKAKERAGPSLGECLISEKHWKLLSGWVLLVNCNLMEDA